MLFFVNLYNRCLHSNLFFVKLDNKCFSLSRLFFAFTTIVVFDKLILLRTALRVAVLRVNYSMLLFFEKV